MPTTLLRCLFTAAAIGILGASTLTAADWNQWRGPGRDGIVSDSDWPDKLTDHLDLAWEKPLGPSYSGPVVHDGKVFTTETVDRKFERVTAYDLDSGEVAWAVQWEGSMSVPFFAASNGDWIRSTPVCAEGKLLVLGMRDVLVCLNPVDGTELWKVDFATDFGSPLPSFGAVCSPMVDDGAVYIQTGGAVCKLSLEDGSLIWKTLENSKGMMSSGAFSSPVIAELQGVKQMVVQTREEMCGVELATGNVLWRQAIKSFRGMNILTPLVMGNKIFTSAHSGRAQLFDLNLVGDKWSISEVWNQNTQAYMSSPVMLNDQIYLHLKNERFTSIDPETGKSNWTTRPYGKYWSMATNGDRLLSLSDKGELRLITHSTEEFELVDEVKVAENSWAHLAVQGDLVIVRDLKALKVYRWK
ncbi:PQQ-binding-like beta-propeller repeat protein [Rhodopirellula sp.]|nr:PQQ-binding-like beta-propeller repeat protein [Rhodopirellula sp.]MDB4679257.1 PQQ-binding-like beta-propeller repeat protein [Rhodopirellula sp.]MDC0295532.1 PQQ-binding-like beta-propeller repeat protein [bacterium]